MKAIADTKKNRRRGFTLAETLLVVAIIIILTGITSVSVIKYQRNICQVEYDGIAKEIFVAAQNAISTARGQGYLGRTGFGRSENEDLLGDEGVNYFVVGSSYGSLTDADSVLGLILPNGSIDDTVRLGGSYVIRYQVQSGIILDVFYSEKNNKKFGHTFSNDEYDSLMTVYRSNAEGRKNYGEKKQVIGYYGGAVPAAVYDDTELLAPTVSVVNAERLTLCVKPAKAADKIRLTITGEDSGAQKIFDTADSSINSYFRTSASDYFFLLDDISAAGTRFADILGGDGFIPGENLFIAAQAYLTDDSGNEYRTVTGAVKRTNSIFADLEDGDDTTAVISNIRHLENLSRNVSAFDGTITVGSKVRTVSGAVQTTDLSWPDFRSAVGNDTLSYVPVTPAAELSYDGGGYTVSRVSFSDSGNAGMFGTLNGGVVKDLLLENFSICSFDGSAGALVGDATGVVFSNILAYNNTSYGPDDSGYSICSDSGDAGGLIGAMTGGSVKNCAAAVYVNAGGYAGGLIGSALYAQGITSSYSGGHTSNARYTQDSGFNVTGALGAGGLVGCVAGPSAAGANTEVSYSYSTCSVCAASGGYAGGLAGKAEKALFKYCYTTAFVKKIGTCGNYIGMESSCSFEGTNYYLTNLSPGVSTADSIKAYVTGVSGKNDSMPNFIFLDTYSDRRMPAYIYDDTLKVDFGGKYYFPTVEQLHKLNGDPSYQAVNITAMHYGDWQVPNLESLGFEFVNADTLYLDIDPQKMMDEGDSFKENYFVVSITGDTGDESVFYQIFFDGGVPLINCQGALGKDGHGEDVIKWETGEAKVKNPLPIAKDPESGHIIITLDDITKSGESFNELFDGTALIPGENLSVSLIIGQNVGIKQFDEVEAETQNSLFAKGSDGNTAVIKYIRHLQNLDPVVSGLEDSYTKAKLANDITWDSDAAVQYATIYNSDSTQSVSGTFYGLYNPNIAEFDGDGHTLRNFPIKAASGNMSATGAANAGLFRYAASDLSVHDLRMLDCVIGDDTYTENAGSVIAQSNYCRISLDTILVDSKAQTVRAKGTAGGLIGIGGASAVTINNSAASVCVSAQNGNAGGLVANLDGSAGTITKSYSGGHTVNGVFATNSASDYNIRSANGAAGGLVGIATGNSLKISQSFSAASVAAQNTSQPAGGLIGGAYTSSAVELSYVYAIAPVYNVKTVASGSSTPAGALVGNASQTVKDTASATSVYYLPELYVGAADSSALSAVAAIGSGSFNRTPGFAYYQKDAAANLIAAKTYKETMQIKTIAFDTSLASNRYSYSREYPFSIWTSFDFDGKINRTSGYTLGTYYGDWQPVDSFETVAHNIIFAYTNPVTANYVSLENETLGKQVINENEVNRVLTPYVEPFTGYQITSWKVSYTYKDGSVMTENMVTNTGYLQFTEDQCCGDIIAEAQFVEVPHDETECTLSFYYDRTDPTGKNYETKGISVFEQIGDTDVYPKNTDLSMIESPVRVIEGYNFVGWYDSPDFKGSRYDLEKDESDTELFLDADLKLYAKYDHIEYYNITIDFMFSPSGDPANYQHLQSVPRYRLDDQPQYRIQCVKGTNFADDIKLPNVGTNFSNPTLTDYSNHDADYLRSCNLYITSDGSKVHIETLVDNDEEDGEDTASEDLNLIVVYQIEDMDTLDFVPYEIEYVLADTDDNGNYKAGASYSYNPYAGTDHTVYFMAPVGTVINVRPMDSGTIPGTSLELEGYVVDEIEKLTITENAGDNVVHVYYSRREFVLTFNSLGGTYVYPATCIYGTALSKVKPVSADMKRQGYSLDTTKGSDGWTILDLGVNFADNTSIATTYRWNQTMPAANIVAWANWKSAPVGFRVMYWYENSDSNNAGDPNNYSYMGSQNGTKNSGALIESADYRTYSGLPSGSSWKDTAHFTFNSALSETKTVSSDGTTVLNVYFTRNSYTLTFKGIKRCSKEEHTHSEDCYAICKISEHPAHTEECLICQKEEHIHSAVCCILEEHMHTYECCSIEKHIHSALCCTKTEHTHTAACCSYEENHVHSSGCGVKSYDSSSASSTINTMSKNNVKASGSPGGILQSKDGKWYVSVNLGMIGISWWRWCPITAWNCDQVEGHIHGDGSCDYSSCTIPVHTHGDGSCICSKPVHTHDDGSCDYSSCTSPVHTHGDGNCACAKEEHVHSDAENCYKDKVHVHTDACMGLICGKEEHRHKDCFTRNSSSTYTITAKYDEEIKNYFPIYADGAVQAWSDTGRTYSNALVSLDRMPGNNVTFNRYSSYDSRSTINTIYYYAETANSDDPSEKTVNGLKFEQYKTVQHKFNYLTYDEEFHTIAGFDRYAHTCSDNGRTKHKTPSTDNTGHSMYPIDNVNELYYTRNSYNIEFYIGGEKVHTTSVKYEARLADVTYKPTNEPVGYTFDGWYKDPGLTNKFDFGTSTMPLGNLAVYGRWAPPSYQVTFNADYIATAEPSEAAVYKASVTKKAEGTTVKYDSSDAAFRSFIVEKGSNISDYITDAKGFILNSYTPEKSGYTFEGWCYDLVNTPGIEDRPFISSIAITEPIVVYAAWKPIENSGDMRDVTIYYYHALQNKPIMEATVIKDTYRVGERPSFTAPEIYGFYPINMVQFLTIQSKTEGSANSITFYYMPIAEWTYRTEYYVSYRNYETETDTSVFPEGTFSSGTSSYLICSTDDIPAYDQFVNVGFSFPEGYEEGYRLVQYNSNGSIVKTTNTIAQLAKRDASGTETDEELKMLNVVKFYIEPDPSKFVIKDRITSYNGESQTLKKEDVTATSCFAFPNREYDVTYNVDLPDSTVRELTTHYYNSVSAGYDVGGSAKAFVANEYRYFTGDGRSVEDPAVPEAERDMIDAGAYRMNGYVVLSVTGIAEGETKASTRTYLEWKNVNYDLNLRIQPREITLTSTTASQAYDPFCPLVRSNLEGDPGTWDIRITGPNDGKAPFVGTDGASYYFAVDAFRLEKGISDNAFTYVLNDSTNKFNYHITTKFGTLTVN